MANFNFNKVIFAGRITREPELKQTPSGVQVATFSIAANRKLSNGEQKADFINCVAWRNTADFVYKYFPKGSAICIVGNLQSRTWDDNNGSKRYALEVIVEEAKFVDSKSDAPTQNAFVAPTDGTATDFVEVGDEDTLPF